MLFVDSSAANYSDLPISHSVHSHVSVSIEFNPFLLFLLFFWKMLRMKPITMYLDEQFLHIKIDLQTIENSHTKLIIMTSCELW